MAESTNWFQTQARWLNHWHRRKRFAFVILMSVTVLAGLLFFEPRYPQPGGDAVRYARYAVTLQNHGTFARWPGKVAEAPAPSRLHTPLYPAWLAMLASVDTDFLGTITCVAEDATGDERCPLHMDLVVTAQLLLLGVFFFATWLLAARLSGKPSIAWLAAAFAYISASPLSYGNQLLTEALILPLGSLFLLFLVLGYMDRQRWWLLAAGLVLGLMALTRPAYAYLFYVSAAVLMVACVRFRRKPLYWASILFVLGYGLITAPWMLRNDHHFDRLALTSGFAGKIMAQRVGFNQMTPRELGIAFVYWFPDFGDDLARAIFDDPGKHLGWGKKSYYANGHSVLYPRLLKELKSDEAVLRHLIRADVLAHPVKHALVSLPLAWRGLFVAKYWGLVGVICLALVLVRWRQTGGIALLIACFPIAFMVFFHAQVSPSVPRYNLPMIPVMAYAMAWAAYALGGMAMRHVSRWRVRSD